jgi:hypothetical protein
MVLVEADSSRLFCLANFSMDAETYSSRWNCEDAGGSSKIKVGRDHF